jgi:3-deoxy-manno-octulosonate cytidylyltransferase (CMP-KDO synthetase)
MQTIAVIPARYRSQRLPGKPLADIGGIPMIEHVYRRAAAARHVDRILVATDDARIREVVRAFGGEACLSASDHESGTDRVAEAVAELAVELVVNVQADEPFLEPASIDAALLAAREDHRAITTLKTRLRSREELWDPDVVKVVTDSRGYAIYFSRWPIPFEASPRRDRHALAREMEEAAPSSLQRFKHVGLYVFPKPVLLEFAAARATPLERAEGLEQLRAIENGIPIRVVETHSDSLGVDTPGDLEQARALAARLAVSGRRE